MRRLYEPLRARTRSLYIYLDSCQSGSLNQEAPGYEAAYIPAQFCACPDWSDFFNACPDWSDCFNACPDWSDFFNACPDWSNFSTLVLIGHLASNLKYQCPSSNNIEVSGSFKKIKIQNGRREMSFTIS